MSKDNIDHCTDLTDEENVQLSCISYVCDNDAAIGLVLVLEAKERAIAKRRYPLAAAFRDLELKLKAQKDS